MLGLKLNHVSKRGHWYLRGQSNVHWSTYIYTDVMTPSNGNIFRVTGPLWGESTGHRWVPLTKASAAELWCFIWSTPEKKKKKKNGRVNNREAGDLRRHRAHCDVIVTSIPLAGSCITTHAQDMLEIYVNCQEFCILLVKPAAFYFVNGGENKTLVYHMV